MKSSTFFELAWQSVDLGLDFLFFGLIFVWFLGEFEALVAANGFAYLEAKAFL